jgi:hypothetical protein
MWTPYQTRSNYNKNNSNKLNGRQEMYSQRDYLQAVLESGRKTLIIIELICWLRFCSS